jgi:phenylpropionate dioxygenase-like ring-hydroxylating dioxygenase large terminal subunit
VQGLKAELLRGFWYVAVPGKKLAPGAMTHLVMLGEPVLVGRGKDGKVFALRNICPHRGVQLHHGTFDGETITCSYHAWRYDRSGACVGIPSMTDAQKIDMTKIRCGSYPCVESQGIVWVWFARAGEPPSGDRAAPPQVPLFAAARKPDVTVDLVFPCSIDHTTYGLMDPAHVAYVHTSRWFRAKKRHVTHKEKSFEPAGYGFKMAQHVVPDTQTFYKVLGKRVTTDISYSLPGIRIEEIHGDRYSVVGLTALTPISDSETMFHQMWFLSMGWGKPFRPVIKALTLKFLNQDRDIAIQQSEGLQYEPKLMLINDANTQARWWMHLKDEWANSQKEGRPFANPLKPKTLRWMS